MHPRFHGDIMRKFIGLIGDIAYLCLFDIFLGIVPKWGIAGYSAQPPDFRGPRIGDKANRDVSSESMEKSHSNACKSQFTMVGGCFSYQGWLDQTFF